MKRITAFWLVLVIFGGLAPFSALAQPQPKAAPVASFTYDNTTLCLGDSTVFESTSSNYENLHWYFGDGTDTWSREMPRHRYENAGNYTVSLVAVNGEGTDSVSASIEIFPLPDFEILHTADTILAPGAATTLYTEETFAGYLWSNASTESSITVSQTNVYWVEVTDQHGCQNRDSVTVVVVRESIKIRSNVLTPNNDGINDFFEIEDIGSYDYPCELTIYNIWNQKVYQEPNYLNQWGGDGLDAGTYFYLIRSADREDKVGSINILR